MARPILRSTVLAVAVCCALAGCFGREGDPPPAPPSPSSTAEPPPPPTPPAKLTVAVNVWALAWLVDRIGGDLVDPAVLFEAEAHEEPSKADLDMLNRDSTHAVVYVGNLSSEAKAALDARAAKAPERFLDLAAVEKVGMEPAPQELDEQLPDGRDPHVWLDPGPRMVEIATAVAGALKFAVAQHSELGRYQIFYGNELGRRLNDVVEELKGLKTQMEGSLISCAGRTLVPEHPAYQYLAQAFGLKQLALTRIGNSNRVPPEFVEAQERILRELWQKEKPSVIFMEQSKGFGADLGNDDERLYFHRLANTHNADLRYLSSLEKPPERANGDDRERSYPDAMLLNAEQIKLGLKC